MTTNQFIAAFCGPDRDEYDTIRENCIRDRDALSADMASAIRRRHITGAEHIDVKEAAALMWERAGYDDVWDNRTGK